jgi:hypothetical protein
MLLQVFDPVFIIDLLSKGSSVVLAVVLVGFVAEWIVPGKTHRGVITRLEGQIQKREQDITRLQEKLDEQTDLLVEAVRTTGSAVSTARKRVT